MLHLCPTPDHVTHTDISLQTETALMYDAALLFATALGELDRSQDIETAVLSCDSELTWQQGNSLINYMKLVSSGRGIICTTCTDHAVMRIRDIFLCGAF